MPAWKACTLGDLVTFQRGHDLPKSEVIEGPYPIAGSNGIIGYHHKFSTKAPSITIGRSGNIGNPHFYNKDFWAHNTTLFVKEFKGSDPLFVYYLLKTMDFGGHNSGSAVPSLNRNFIHPMKIRIPESIEEQKAIAKILSAFDEKIELNRRMNATLEAMARALFKAWFVDFEPVHANRENRPSTSASPEIAKLFPSEFENGIPKGWLVRKLGDTLSIAYGKNLPTTHLIDSGYPVFGGNGIIGYHSTYLYENPQVLVACRGAASGKINQSRPRSFVTNNSLILQTNQETELGFNYLKHFMLGVDATAFVTGSAQPQVTIENIKHLQTLIPNVDALKSFEGFGSPLEELIFRNQVQSESLAQVRDSLLPRLISGKIQVTADSEGIE
ncbi:MAG TPA: restriction endonuclease subunit S [Pyrinomonadaceae bacterium]|nr:restriction endonuclease subunit S [Pyrinomonadaceae bacterium]